MFKSNERNNTMLKTKKMICFLLLMVAVFPFSTIAGWDWNKCDTNRENNWEVVGTSADGTKMLACAWLDAVYTSIDSGATWTKRDPTGKGDTLFWDAGAVSGDGSTMIVANGGFWGDYMYKSTDAGVSWTKINTAPVSWSSISISFDGSTGIASAAAGAEAKLFTSNDGCQTWIERLPTGQTSYLTFRDVSISSDGNLMAMCASTSESLPDYVYLSTDGGITWTKCTNNGVEFKQSFYTISLSADGTSILAGTYENYLYLSKDSGANWTQLSPTGSVQFWMCSAISNDGSTLLAGAWNGLIHKSDDAGATWTSLDPYGDAATRTWTSLAMTANGGKFIVCDGGLRSTYGFVFISPDAGASWGKANIPSIPPLMWRAAASSATGQKLVAADYDLGYFVTSADSGATWTRRYPAGADFAFWKRWSGVSMSSDGTKIAACAYGNQNNNDGDYVYLSSDTGTTWTRVSPAAGNIAKRYADISMSADGATIMTCATSSSNPYTDYVYVSTDSGANWTQCSPDTPALTKTWISCAVSSDGTKLAACDYSNVFFSGDNGATWIKLSPPLESEYNYIKRIKLTSNASKIVLTSGNFLLISSDNGATWTTIYPAGQGANGQWATLSISSDANIIMSSAYENGLVYRSTDGGTTWVADASLGDRSWRALALNAAGTRSLAVADYVFLGIANQTAEYTISATSGTGGTITPPGSIAVKTAESQSFNITAANGYLISDIVVDAISVGKVSSYTFTNVTANHTIAASFAAVPATAQLIMQTSPSAGGSTTPSEGTWEENTQIPIQITAEAYTGSGYSFLNWTATTNATVSDPNAATTNVTLIGDATVTANFAKNGITLVSPNGGERWIIDTTHAISWDSIGVSGNVKIDLYKQGQFYQNIVESVMADDGTYSWTIPAIDPPTLKQIAKSSFYKVRITSLVDETIYGESNDYFTITDSDLSIAITAPSGGDTWQIGTAKDITWTSSGVTGMVNFKLYKNGALVTLYPIIPDTDVTLGTVSWLIPEDFVPGINYSFRIESVTNSSIYSSGGFFAITETGATATLTMEANPNAGGTVGPISGEVDTNEAIQLTANPATGYSFLRWIADPVGNAKFENPNLNQTTVTITGNVTVTGVFSEVVADGVFTTDSKVKITLNNSLPNKDKVSITKASLPTDLTADDVPAGATIMINFDEYSLPVGDGRKDSNGKITFSGKKTDNSSKYKLVLDFDKALWSFSLSNANIAADSLIDSFDGVDISLEIKTESNEILFGENIDIDESVAWKFDSEKNNSDPLETAGDKWQNFDISKADGKLVTNKTDKDQFSVTKALAEGDAGWQFNPNVDTVMFSLDDWEVNLDEADPESKGWKTSKQKYTFNGIYGGMMSVQVILDFTTGKEFWKVKITKANFSGLIEGMDGLDVILRVNEYEGGLRLEVVQTTTLIYPVKN